MKNIFSKAYKIAIALVSLWFSLASFAEDASGAQANNPLASSKSLGLQNYYIGDFTDAQDGAIGEYGNQTWLRYAQPFTVGDTNWILRASLPVNHFPSFDDHTTGLGDANIFAAYLFDTGNPTLSFGLGPQLTMPTATDDALGSEQWSAGLVNVFFNGSSPKFQYGYLLSWQHSFAGNKERNEVNIGAFQPFAFYQLGDGWYLRSTPVMVYNFENDTYDIPIGLGAGKVVKTDFGVFNFFIEPQYSVAFDGAGQPKWQILAGLNLQF